MAQGLASLTHHQWLTTTPVLQASAGAGSLLPLRGDSVVLADCGRLFSGLFPLLHHRLQEVGAGACRLRAS